MSSFAVKTTKAIRSKISVYGLTGPQVVPRGHRSAKVKWTLRVISGGPKYTGTKVIPQVAVKKLTKRFFRNAGQFYP